MYAFHDRVAHITLLGRSVANKLGLQVKKYMQPSKGFLATADVEMGSASIDVRGLREMEYHHMIDPRVTKQLPSISHFLPHTLMIEEHPTVLDVDYPTLDHQRYDLLIGMVHVKLVEPPADPCIVPCIR